MTKMYLAVLGQDHKSLDELRVEAQKYADQLGVPVYELPQAVKARFGPAMSDMYANVAGHNENSAAKTKLEAILI